MWTRESRGQIAEITRKTKRCTSDLTDAEWERIRRLLPDAPARGRRWLVYLREMLNAIHYMARSADGWRMLPTNLAPRQTVHWWFRRLCGCCCSGPFTTSP